LTVFSSIFLLSLSIDGESFSRLTLAASTETASLSGDTGRIVGRIIMGAALFDTPFPDGIF
jgi:hypothetical protein